MANAVVESLNAYSGPTGKRTDYTDWQPMEAAPGPGELCLGVGATDCVMPMIRGGLKPSTKSDESFTKALGWAGADEIWWARYPDGGVGSFSPTHWREAV